MKVHIFATDMLPFRGEPTNGRSLRAHCIAEGLRAAGCDVVVSVPKQTFEQFTRTVAGPNLSESERAGLRAIGELAFDCQNQAALIEDSAPDVIFCGHWPAFTLSGKPRQTLILDLAGPSLLPGRAGDRRTHAKAIEQKRSILPRADVLICSSAAQQRYFAKFLPKGSPLIQRFLEIPMVLPVDAPEPHPSLAYPRFLCSGHSSPWQDPTRALKRLVRALNRRRSGTLTIVGAQRVSGEQLDPEGTTPKMQRLLGSLRRHARISQEPRQSFERYADTLRGIDVAIDLMERNPERELAVPVKTASYTVHDFAAQAPFVHVLPDAAQSVGAPESSRQSPARTQA